jgi:DNA-binding NarL/FixJ family response regulator
MSPSEGHSRRLRILVVDDHEIVREGLTAVLEADSRYEIVGTASTGRAALEQARRTLPDVVLLDLRLPDTSGEDVCRKLRSRFPSTAVVVLTTYLSEGTVRSALDAGATAYVTKSAGLSELRSALETVASGQERREQGSGPQIVQHLHELVTQRIGESVPTPRQEQILDLAARGLTNREIGEQLYLSESTVRFHIQKLKEKLGAHTKTELIAKAIRTGLIAPASDAPEELPRSEPAL